MAKGYAKYTAQRDELLSQHTSYYHVKKEGIALDASIL